MRLVFERGDALVFDDLLPPPAFEALSAHIEGLEYRSVHARHWKKSWRLSDGDPLRGPAVYFDPGGRFHGDEPVYPTGTPLDPVVEAVRQAAALHPAIVGTEGRDWISLFLSPWLYPVGSGLSYHRDGGEYSGSFTFFVNASWRLDWGGLLLLGDESTPVEPVRDAWGEKAAASGARASWASCICPRPNRLALIGPDCGHMITRVDRNAGSSVRASVAGFFLRS